MTLEPRKRAKYAKTRRLCQQVTAHDLKIGPATPRWHHSPLMTPSPAPPLSPDALRRATRSARAAVWVALFFALTVPLLVLALTWQASRAELRSRAELHALRLPSEVSGRPAMDWNDLWAAFALYLVLEGVMPFANPGRGEYGTYFIGYTRRLWVIEQMLERMFIGNPAPLHDRILDFSTATTGVTFFAPSRKVLADLGD